jgi:serine/threonine protein kinase/WD40 repeat protein
MNAEEIFLAAVEKKTSAERAAYVEGACGNNAELRARVAGLLHSHEQAGSFLDEPLFEGPTTAPEPIMEGPGTSIGPYKLMEQIGEGGMGLVFVAEQQHPVHRKVALKVIKPGMDSRDVIARFEAERQALALMDHPNIARVLDAGTTDSGRPYFVMELVRGIPITDYCDQHQLTPRERLELFVTVCRAVQHAHTKAIIHRDLKPTNILVASNDGVPLVKVIDFGVAKALGQRLTDKTIYTRFTQMIGTPLYMSPEQAEISALDPDTRSDIYSLGVLLYELLTGTTPFDRQRLRDAAFDEIRRIIREEEPPTPSVRLSTLGVTLSAVSVNRKMEPRALSALVRGDLDWIAMKALEKDRSRRYETASAFAADVRRFLKEEPVEARPPSALYRFRKFARRNHIALTTAALIAVALLAGTAISTWQAVRATGAEEEARYQESLAKEAAVQAGQQRDRAALNEQRARDNEHKAEKERDAATRAREELRDLLYSSNMNGAYRAWQENNLGRLSELLQQTHPKTGEPDLRGFEWHFLNRVAHPKQMTLKAMTEAAVSYSRDSTRVAAANASQVMVWDARTGNVLHDFQIPTKDARTWAVNPDCTAVFVVTSHPGKTNEQAASDLELIDLATGKPRYQITVGSEMHLPRQARMPNLGVASLSHDGKWLLVGQDLFDAATGAKHLVLSEKPQTNLASFSADGRWLLAGNIVFDLKTGKKHQPLNELSPETRWAAFSPDGSHLVTAKGEITLGDKKPWGGEIKVWNPDSGKMRFVWKDLGEVAQVVFHPDSRRFAAVLFGQDTGYSVKLWDAQSGKETQQFQAGANDLVFSPDGRWMATAFNYEVFLWDLTSGKIFNTFYPGATHVWSVAFSPDGSYLAAGQRFFPLVTAWDMGAVRTIGRPDAEFTKKGMPDFVLAPSPDGQHVAWTSGARPGPWVKLASALTGLQEWTVNLQPQESPRDLAFHPHGELLAVAVNAKAYTNAATGKVIFLDTKTGQRLTQSIGEHQAIWAMAFSPDGRLLATAHTDAVRLWDTATWKEQLVFRGHHYWVSSVTFSPDSKKVLSFGLGAPPKNEPEVLMWEADTGKELFRFKESINHGIRSLAFSTDGKWFATSWTVRNAQTGAVVFELKPDFNYAVINVAFTPDSRRLATDGQVMLFDVPTGQVVGRLKHKEEAPVHMIAFSRDGQRAVALNEDSTLQIWDATPQPTRLDDKGQ